jgi:hypothetical protein
MQVEDVLIVRNRGIVVVALFAGCMARAGEVLPPPQPRPTPRGDGSSERLAPAQVKRLAEVAALIDGMVARHFGEAGPQEQQNWRRLIGATGLHESKAFTRTRNGDGYGYYHMEAWVALSHLAAMARQDHTPWMGSLPIGPALRGEVKGIAELHEKRLRGWNREAFRLYPGADRTAEKLRLNHVASAQHRYFSTQAERLRLGNLLRANPELATALCAYHYQQAGVGGEVRFNVPLTMPALSRIWVEHYNLAGPGKEHHRASAFVRSNGQPEAQQLHQFLDQRAASSLADGLVEQPLARALARGGVTLAALPSGAH